MTAPQENINKTKIEILWKLYLMYIFLAIAFLAVVIKVCYIQFWEKNYWMALSNKQQIKQQIIETPRGTIYSSTGDILSISLPRFDVYMDLGVKSLRTKVAPLNHKEQKVELFYIYLDSLSLKLAKINPYYSADYYKKKLLIAFKNKIRYLLLLSNIDYHQYQDLQNFSFVKLGQNKSGIIFDDDNKREYPYGRLAYRTIGLYRPEIGKSVGLELAYDSVLKGRPGKKIVKKIAPNVYIPIEGTNIEPERGNNIYTNLDMNIQNIVYQALYSGLKKYDATWGTVIVMEVKTGKIKAICNLGKIGADYYENFNYGIERHEPGSTFKLMSMLALLDNNDIDIHKMVNVNYGKWKYGKDTIFDSEVHPHQSLSVEDIFCLSSNVGTARLITQYFGGKPKIYTDYLSSLRINEPINLLPGEDMPMVKNVKMKEWTPTTLAWMSFGYEVMLTPLQILALYNGVANDGVMMQPYLIERIEKDGKVLQHFEPIVRVKKIASEKTIQTIQYLLEEVVKKGTAKSINTSQYGIAGKTGTAKVAGVEGYKQKVYQASFAGYFPTQNPMYSCIVLVQNKKGNMYFGATVAAPIFRDIADKLMNQYVFVNINYANTGTQNIENSSHDYTKGLMPDLTGWSLQNAFYVLENQGVHILFQGKGKILEQSIPPGTLLKKNMNIILKLGT